MADIASLDPIEYIARGEYMPTPPSLKTILPSIELKEGSLAIIGLADVLKRLPSLEIICDGRSIAADTIRVSIEDLRKFIRLILSDISIDEVWYLTQVPGLRNDIQKGRFASVKEHYMLHGYLEGRLPEKPIVDEEFYCEQYPDVAAAIRAGEIKSGYEHFVKDGYAEGRIPTARSTTPVSFVKKIIK